VQAATDFMKEVVRPMLEASQTLAAKTRRQGPPNYRRILFEGGYCVFSGGASAINLASRAEDRTKRPPYATVINVDDKRG
jgi:hypothetical protein